MRVFDNATQELKYKVLKEVAKLAFEGRLSDSYYAIPRILVSDSSPAMRCCIYKDRAIVEEMVRNIIGIWRIPNHLLDVLDIACDECPIDRYTVSEGCRGCISHRCVSSCPVQAIRISKTKKAVIDIDKCIECGKCFKACPYNAIRENVRPCVRACKIGAIKVEKTKKASIDYNKCVSCGACMMKCPFGAIQDRSYILDTINILKDSNNNTKYKVYAMVAPSIGTQFNYADVEQVCTALKMLGVYDIYEVALGADITAYKDAHEFAEKGALMSSCCPSFVEYVTKQFPHLAGSISENPSPMVECAKLIKKQEPNSKVIFIGPCVSKKGEATKPEVSKYVDNVITFEELQAIIDSKEIKVEELAPTQIKSASYFGRVFARVGGVSEAVKNVIAEEKLDIKADIMSADGLDNIKIALLKNNKGLAKGLFIEGMACSGGCVNGPGCVNHDARCIKTMNEYSEKATKENVCGMVKENLKD
ncbi:MAG: monomeric [FeFe] hydrogenase [Clostridia bacterium]|nr:monomeric [FeFe] hydrogenase [Clostridia bacterium]